MLRHQRIARIRCAPKRAPCPTCGRRGYCKRILHRRLRTLAYHRIAWLQVTYAEYQSRCACCHYFRTWPLDVPQARHQLRIFHLLSGLALGLLGVHNPGASLIE